MRSRRLELPQGFPHKHLKLARLPFRHDRIVKWPSMKHNIGEDTEFARRDAQRRSRRLTKAPSSLRKAFAVQVGGGEARRGTGGKA